MAEKGGIQVLIKVFGGIRDKAPSGPLQVTIPSPGRFYDVLRALERRVPVLHAALVAGLESGYVSALLNGRNVLFLGGDETPMADGDTLAFLPPVGGG